MPIRLSATLLASSCALLAVACAEPTDLTGPGPGRVYLTVRRSLVQDYGGVSLAGTLRVVRFQGEDDVTEPPVVAAPSGVVVDGVHLDLTDGAIHDFVVDDDADGEIDWVRAYLDTDDDGVFPEPDELYSDAENYGTEPDFTSFHSLLLDHVAR